MSDSDTTQFNHSRLIPGNSVTYCCTFWRKKIASMTVKALYRFISNCEIQKEQPGRCSNQDTHHNQITTFNLGLGGTDVRYMKGSVTGNNKESVNEFNFG